MKKLLLFVVLLVAASPLALFAVDYRLSSDASLEVRDMLRRVVHRTTVSSGTTQLTIDASAWPNGLYMYSLTDGTYVQSRIMMILK